MKLTYIIALGFPIYNNFVSGPLGASDIPPNGVFTLGKNPFSNVATNNFYPAVGSVLIKAGVNRQLPSSGYDFNGKKRSKTTPTVGAYVS